MEMNEEDQEIVQSLRVGLALFPKIEDESFKKYFQD